MQLIKVKRPCIVAGLVAALGAGAVFVASPVAASAEEMASSELSAVTTGAWTPVETEPVEEAPSAASFMVVEDASDVSTEEPPSVGVPSTKDETAAVEGGASAPSAPTEGQTPDVSEGEPGEAETDSDETAAEEGPVDAPEEPSVATDAGDSASGTSEDGDGAFDTTAVDSEEHEEVVASDDAELLANKTYQNQWVSDGRGSYQWYDANGNVQESGWLVTDVAIDNSKGDLQRYWLGGDDGSVVMGLFEAAINGISSWFFGTDGGYVVRGSYTDPETGYVYLADNDGRLANPGWVVSDAYGQGLQRYRVDEKEHACIPGFSEDGWAHYTTDEGYVVRGATTASDGSMRYADNDGRLQESGWLITDDFGQGLQRYWLEDFEVARDTLIEARRAGWTAYATSEGYVVRGGNIASDGSMRYADNDGRLQESGWLVTDAFGQGLQRYWLEAFEVVKDRFISAAQAGWEAYATDKGYVLRGSIAHGDGVLLANNDGKLESGTGWLVTGAYENGALQRYYLKRSSDGGHSYAVSGFFEADLPGYGEVWFFGDTSHGYVARGKTNTSDGLLISNNDGVLAENTVDFREGFTTTNEFDGTSQTYYFVKVKGHFFAKTGVFSVGSKRYFGRPDAGYIVKGKTAYGAGMIIAASDGALFFQDANGFVVTDEVDGELQRYYIVDLGDGVKGAKVGSFSVGSDQYYGREDQGYVVRGSYTTPDGKLIYADGDGKITYDFLTPAGWAAWERAKNFDGGLYSFTQYCILVDTTNNRVVVFQGTYIPELTWYGNWTPLYDWSCSTGNKAYHNGQGTPTGIYRIGGNADYNWNESGNYTPGGYRTTYWAINDVTYFTGFILNLGFHSTIGYQGGYSDPSQLGKHITHGCIRLAEENAKWIYYNATQGTKVYVY